MLWAGVIWDVLVGLWVTSVSLSCGASVTRSTDLAIWMPFSFNVTVSGVVAKILNGLTVFGSSLDRDPLTRRADSDTNAGSRSLNTICLSPNSGACQGVY